MTKHFCNCCGRGGIPLITARCHFRGVSRVLGDEDAPLTMELSIHLCSDCFRNFANPEVIEDEIREHKELMAKREEKRKEKADD